MNAATKRTLTCIECGAERSVAAKTGYSKRCHGCAHKGRPATQPNPAPPGGFASLHPERHPRLACRDYPESIGYYETRIDTRPRPKTVIGDALRAAGLICARCPLTEACQTAAEVERYTGIAGGHVWSFGRRVA